MRMCFGISTQGSPFQNPRSLLLAFATLRYPQNGRVRSPLGQIAKNASRRTFSIHHESRQENSKKRHNGRGRWTSFDELEGGQQERMMPAKADRGNPEAWISILENFLPPKLRSPDHRRDAKARKLDQCTSVLDIISHARSLEYGALDLLAYLGLQQGRWAAVHCLADVLLKGVTVQEPSDEPPSNLPWPTSTSLHDLTRAPISFDDETFTSRFHKKRKWDSEFLDISLSLDVSTLKDPSLAQIWQSLGGLIMEAADLPHDDAQIVMTAVYQIIAKVHNYGLISDSVYFYNPSCYSSLIHRPPVLHLSSSRILTTLSDAVWRAHQDEVIAQAVESGADSKNLRQDPPGGRFRLKVRELGPEIWLEFVLWCCVDGGFATAGARIVEKLQRRSENPWFAMNWILSSSGSSSTQSSTIDWAKVRLRYGGAVGLIEGYSGEPPFAVMNPRTISTEVILALVELNIISINVGVKHGGLLLSTALNFIKSLVTFLEPHSLPPNYLEYLAVHILQSHVFDFQQRPWELQNFQDILLYLFSLESATKQVDHNSPMSLESIIQNSEFVPGVLHQTLDAFIMIGDIRQALEVFTQIQQRVDESKLKSVDAFLRNPPNKEGFFSSRIWAASPDFTMSHGQIPIYKLAAFLDLVTESRLLRLGNWLLYSDDADGPVIPESAYNFNCIAPSLARFAAISKDEHLLKKLDNPGGGRMPSVGLLRAIADANISLVNFDIAALVLYKAKKAKAGGFSPRNIATLGSVILRMEHGALDQEHRRSKVTSENAITLMNTLLQGELDGNRGDFTLAYLGSLRRQISSLLRIFECFPKSALSKIARSWSSKYEAGNDIALLTEDFNTLLSGVVAAMGAKEGMRIWDLFCADPRQPKSSSLPLLYLASEPGMIAGLPEFVDEEELSNEAYDGSPDLRMDIERRYSLGKHSFVVSFDEHQALAENDIEQEHNSTQAFWGSDIDHNYNKDPAPPSSDLDIPFNGASGFFQHPNKELKRSSKATSRSPAVKDLPSQSINPLVVPNLHTLRVIVRAAVAEHRSRLAENKDNPAHQSEHNAVLHWAPQFFRAFGRKRPSVELEIQQRLDEDWDAPGMEAIEKNSYESARTGSKLKEPRKMTLRKNFLQHRKVSKYLSKTKPQKKTV